MTRGLYYFAHPYSCIRDGEQILSGIQANFQLASYRAGELVRRGFNVYSPISHSHPIQTANPHLAMLRGTEEGELWYSLDNEVIDKTNFDGIILAPGWEDSVGCRAEKKRMEDQGKEILYYEEIV